MLKIKKKLLLPVACVLALMCCLPGCKAEEKPESLIGDDLLTSEQANYKTIQVETGDYTKDVSGKATIVYLENKKLCWEGGAVYYKETTVRTGQTVKKGDVLMRFDTEENRISQETLKLQLARVRESAKKQEASKLEALNAAKAEAETLQGYEQKIALLQVEKLQIAYEQFQYETQKSIRKIQEQIDELQRAAEQNVLVAPFDGVIQRVTRFNTGDKITSGVQLITMYSTERFLLMVEDTLSKLRYNMDVLIDVGKDEKGKTYKGKVVTASDILPASMRKNYALIALEETVTSEDLKGGIKFRATLEEVRDILLVERKAVEKEDGKEFVYVLDGDMVQKRYIKTAEGTVNVWVLDGLTEGQTLIVD